VPAVKPTRLSAKCGDAHVWIFDESITILCITLTLTYTYYTCGFIHAHAECLHWPIKGPFFIAGMRRSSLREDQRGHNEDCCTDVAPATSVVLALSELAALIGLLALWFFDAGQSRLTPRASGAAESTAWLQLKFEVTLRGTVSMSCCRAHSESCGFVALGRPL
jgi:hypothetical protein